MFYLDTSIFLKRYKTEPGSDVVATLFDGRVEAEILTTPIQTGRVYAGLLLHGS